MAILHKLIMNSRDSDIRLYINVYMRATEVDARSYNDACTTLTQGRSQSDRTAVDVVSYCDANTTNHQRSIHRSKKEAKKTSDRRVN